MAAFGADGRCLMRALQEELDDPEPADCGRCAVCAGARFDGPARPGARARGRAAPALQADAARGQEDGAVRGRRDAQDPRGRAGRGGPRARAARRRRLGPARAGRAAARGASTTSWSTPPPRPCAAGARPSPGSTAVPSRRSGPLVPDFARAARGGARAAVRGGARADRRRAAAARDGQLGPAGRERARAVRRRRARCRPGRACSSTTCASAAGRWPCSPGSCAAAAPGRSTRSRSPRRSERAAGAALPVEQQPRDLLGVVAHRDVPAAAQPDVPRAGQQPARAQRLGRQQQPVARAPADRRRHARSRRRSDGRRARSSTSWNALAVEHRVRWSYASPGVERAPGGRTSGA